MLILICDTGGGHRASAQSLRAAFDVLYRDKLNITVLDVWREYGNWPFSRYQAAPYQGGCVLFMSFVIFLLHKILSANYHYHTTSIPVVLMPFSHLFVALLSL